MLIANLGLLLTVLAWGSTAPVLNELLKTWDPVALTTVRFTLTSVVFLVWLRLAEGRIVLPGVFPWRQVLWVSVILTSFTTLLTFAIDYSNPINISIISAAGPLAAAVVDRVLNGRNPPGAILMAIPFVVAGGVFSGVDLAAFGESGPVFRFEPGDALMLIAVFLWPTYSALLQRWFGDMSQLRRTSLSFLGATPMIGIVLLVLMLTGVESLPDHIPDAQAWSFVIWTSLATSILGTYFWNVGVKHLGVVVGTMFLNMIPMVAIGVSILFGIQPRMEQIAGGVLVMAGVAAAQYGSMRRQRAGRAA